jgi:hypothetical protein
MRDTCSRGSIRDFRQRYQGTIGSFIKDSGDKMFVWITEVTDRQVEFQDTNGNTYTAIHDNGVTFEFTQVPLGWFNSSKGPLFVCRRPARQYQRGISPGNTFIIGVNGSTISVNLETIADIYTYSEKYSPTMMAWALSKHFAYNNNHFYFYNTVIGTIDQKTSVIKLKTNLYVQEVSDCVKRNGLPFTVEVA